MKNFLKSLKFYLKIWIKLSKISFISMFYTRGAAFLFLLGKTLRFFSIFIFLLAVFSRVKSINGYGKSEIILFYLVYTLIDTISQFLFREVYRFRPKVIYGTFDLDLVKPVSPLFISLLSGADVLDLIMLFFYLIIFIIFILPFKISLTTFLLFLLMVANGLLISAGFHILVLAIGIITIQVDHLVMIFRDMQSLLRIPDDFYDKYLRIILTFILPFAVMIAFPAKTLLGWISLKGLLTGIAISLCFFSFSLLFWKFSLKKYSSASS